MQRMQRMQQQDNTGCFDLKFNIFIHYKFVFKLGNNYKILLIYLPCGFSKMVWSDGRHIVSIDLERFRPFKANGIDSLRRNGSKALRICMSCMPGLLLGSSAGTKSNETRLLEGRDNRPKKSNPVSWTRSETAYKFEPATLARRLTIFAGWIGLVAFGEEFNHAKQSLAKFCPRRTKQFLIRNLRRRIALERVTVFIFK